MLFLDKKPFSSKIAADTCKKTWILLFQEMRKSEGNIPFCSIAKWRFQRDNSKLTHFFFFKNAQHFLDFEISLSGLISHALNCVQVKDGLKQLQGILIRIRSLNQNQQLVAFSTGKGQKCQFSGHLSIVQPCCVKKSSNTTQHYCL